MPLCSLPSHAIPTNCKISVGNQLVRDSRPRIFVVRSDLFEAVKPRSDFMNFFKLLTGAAEPNVNVLGLNSEVFRKILHGDSFGSGAAKSAQDPRLQCSALAGGLTARSFGSGGGLDRFRPSRGGSHFGSGGVLPATASFAFGLGSSRGCGWRCGPSADCAANGGFDLFEFSNQRVPLFCQLKKVAKCGCGDMGCVHESNALAIRLGSVQAKSLVNNLC